MPMRWDWREGEGQVYIEEAWPDVSSLRGRGLSYLQAVSVDVDLGQGVAAHVDVLDLLGRDVLALRQLEDVLLPVHDLQSSVLSPVTAGVQGTERCHRFDQSLQQCLFKHYTQLTQSHTQITVCVVLQKV